MKIAGIPVGAAGSGGNINYYSTAREKPELEKAAEITSNYIWALYDGLMAQYPDKVQKNEILSDDGTFTNYEYVISTGDYSTEGRYAKSKEDGGYGGKPHHEIKKAKYLISSGMHGHESFTTLYLYRFVRDVLAGHNVPNGFREGAVLHILPVICPWGLDHFNRRNKNDVDINRNFNWNWQLAVDAANDSKKHQYGAAPESEQETQAYVNWLKANQNAALIIDLHNSADMQEKVSVLGCSNPMVDATKKIAMRGLDRIIPFWRDVIGYPASVESYDGTQDVIFSYAAALDGYSTHYGYAVNVLGINMIALELAAFYGDYADWETDRPISAENVAMGAEAIGNVLIEFYNETALGGEADMTEVKEKLDTLVKNFIFQDTFHMESGVHTVDADAPGAETVKVACSSGAKILVLTPDEETYNNIVTMSGPVFLGIVGQMIVPLPFMEQFDSAGNPAPDLRCHGYVSLIKNKSANNTAQVPNYHYAPCNNADGFTFTVLGMKAGKYNWTAYYWDA